MAAPIDDEGNSVMASERGISMEEYKAQLAAGPAVLPEEKAKQLVLKAEEWNLEKMAMSSTDAEFEMTCSAMDYAEIVIEVPPMMSTFEEYFYGFDPDKTDPQFSIIPEESDPLEGKMQRRGGEPTVIKIKCDPNGGQMTQYDAYLCFILPEEKTFSKYYKITCKTTD